MLPDTGKIEESRTRLELLLQNAEKKRHRFLVPVSRYWVSVGLFRNGNYSRAVAEAKTALAASFETDNKYEQRHIKELIAGYYISLGEFEKSTSYLEMEPTGNGSHNENKSQTWRNLFTLRGLLEKLEHPATAVDVARESVAFSGKYLKDTQARDDALTSLARVLGENGKFAEAIANADRAVSLAVGQGRSPENIWLIAGAYRERKSRDKNVLWGSVFRRSGITIRHLIIIPRFLKPDFVCIDVRKGRLLCFHDNKQNADFKNELKEVLKLSEAYRKEIKEDTSRQSL